VRAEPSAPPRLAPGGRRARWEPAAPEYVALDVDGTLVRDAVVPEAAVLDAIAGLVGLGVRVGLATGRMAAAVGPLLATGVFTGPHVLHNGAVVTDGAGVEQVVLGISDAEVAAILAFGRDRDDLGVEVYVGRTYLADRDDPRSAPHAALLRADPSGRISDPSDLGGRPAVKAVLVCFSDTAADDAVAAMVNLGLSAGAAASPATPGIRYVNVTRAGVDKGSGVLAAAHGLGIALAAVAAVGDEANDLPVLSRVGTAIAMGDARADVRAAAHLVAPTFGAGGTLAALDLLATLVTGTTPT
jgi:hydroxymethylpyrimidine pyrophosphatase-like HAD family hydrolase